MAIAGDEELDQLYLTLLKTIYNGDLKGIDIPTTVAEAKDFMQQVFKGFGGNFETLQFGAPDYDKLTHLEQNVYKFSAAKNYQQNRSLQDALHEDGKLLSYTEWERKARAMLKGEWQGSWRRTERVTCLNGGSNAARQVDIDKHPGCLLRFEVADAERSCPRCLPFNGLILPSDHPFVKKCGCPIHFRCGCGWHRINSGKITDEKDLPSIDQITPMFRTNLAAQGKIFPDAHPNFVNLPGEVLHQAERILFKQQQLEAIQRLSEEQVKRSELSAPITFSRKGIKEAFNQPHAQFQEKNSLIRVMDKVLAAAKYKGFKKGYPPDNPGIIGTHIFEFSIADKKSWAIVRQHADGANRFYSISDSKNVLKGIKKKSG